MEPRKLRKIKTIKDQLGNSEYFDKDVNEALADGWYLVRRYVLPSHHSEERTWLVAELQRYDYD